MVQKISKRVLFEEGQMEEIFKGLCQSFKGDKLGDLKIRIKVSGFNPRQNSCEKMQLSHLSVCVHNLNLTIFSSVH